MKYYTDIDRNGHEISRFGGLPGELYFLKGLYYIRENIVTRENLGTTDSPTHEFSFVPVDICYSRGQNE